MRATAGRRRRVFAGVIAAAAIAILMALLINAIGGASSAAAQVSSGAKIYWTEGGLGGWGVPGPPGKVRSANLDGSNVADVVSDTGIAVGSMRPTGIALDSTSGKLYWADFYSGVHAVNVDGSNPQTVSGGPGAVYALQGIDLDLQAGKLYWGPTHWAFAPNDFAKIRRSNLDGSNVQVLVQNAVCWFPGGLAVDFAGGKMYWADVSCNRIFRANLDGSGQQLLLTGGYPQVRDIALDSAGGKMYFTLGAAWAPGSGQIQRVNLDGSGLQTLVSGLNFPWGIDLDLNNGRMYWADINAGKIQRANLDGSNVQDIVTGLTTPMRIAVQPNAPPDCANAVASVSMIWPANHKFVPVSILGVSDPDSDPVTITVTAIGQDEPVDTVGDGSFTPDGTGVGTATAEVRAERSGSKEVPGDGRVYHIGFTADDGKGASCSGVVRVGVPHDQGQKTLIDGGPIYDSTVP